MSEVEHALEQAEIVVEDRSYDEWSRAALIAATVNNMHNKKKQKVTDIIGQPPSKKREKKQQQNKIDTSNKDELRQIALNKGLDVNF